MKNRITIIGAGLAGSEAALQLAHRNFQVRLLEMRPVLKTPVHKTEGLAELVCSNSLKSTKPDSAAGMLKRELYVLGSYVLAAALESQVAAGGALAVDREVFSQTVSRQVYEHPSIELVRKEALSIVEEAQYSDAILIASGPLTSDALSSSIMELTGEDHLAFYDAAAPVVMADSLDMTKLFRQSRYEKGLGDYLNAPFTQDEYRVFIGELLQAKRVISKSFESRELFQACQPIEEIARAGVDAPRFGALKPVGLTDPRTGLRPWAALQLRAEDAFGSSYNLVGFQTNLTFPEQERVFRLIPGLEQAEFARYGVMHRNTFINAPHLLDSHGRLTTAQASKLGVPVYIAGQLSGTEGYCEAMRSGLHAALAITADMLDSVLPTLSCEMVYGALLAYATNDQTQNYQPMHVNFGIMPPFKETIKNKRSRYAAYAKRGENALALYASNLRQEGLLERIVEPFSGLFAPENLSNTQS